PPKGSPLVPEGSIQHDPRLPSYIGAVPPEGVFPWDWDRTWRMPKDAQLLLVSKDEKHGAEFRTINDALKAAKPWATIRVLDSETYNESLSIMDRTHHEGLTLESLRRATIPVSRAHSPGVSIRGTPRVTLRGFRVRMDVVGAFGVFVAGASAGALL